MFILLCNNKMQLSLIQTTCKPLSVFKSIYKILKVCVPVCEFECRHTYYLVCVQRPENEQKCLSSPSVLFEKGLLWYLLLHMLDYLAHEHLFFGSPSMADMHFIIQFSHVLRVWTQILMLTQQELYLLSHLSHTQTFSSIFTVCISDK